jgi:ApbE superfamily uncharacterized protein (UPF0280 family)
VAGLKQMLPAVHRIPISQRISTQQVLLLACFLTFIFLSLRASSSLPQSPPTQQLMSAAASEFVMGIVSAPVAGGVAQSLAKLLVSSKVCSCPPAHL